MYGHIACDSSLRTIIEIDGHIRHRVTEALPSPTGGLHGSRFSSTSVSTVIVAPRLDARMEFQHSIFRSRLWESDTYLDVVPFSELLDWNFNLR